MFNVDVSRMAAPNTLWKQGVGIIAPDHLPKKPFYTPRSHIFILKPFSVLGGVKSRQNGLQTYLKTGCNWTGEQDGQQKASAGSADLATTAPFKDSRRLQTPFCSLKEKQS